MCMRRRVLLLQIITLQRGLILRYKCYISIKSSTRGLALRYVCYTYIKSPTRITLRYECYTSNVIQKSAMLHNKYYNNFIPTN